MKKFLNSRFGESIVLIAASALNLITTIIYYSIHLTDYTYFSEERGLLNLWTAKILRMESYVIRNYNLYFTIAFCVGVLLFVIAAIVSLTTRKKQIFFVSVTYNLILSLVTVFVNIAFKTFRTSAIVFAVISILISTAALMFLIIRRNKEVIEKQTGEDVPLAITVKPKQFKIYKVILLICELFSTLIMAVAFTIPLYTEHNGGTAQSFVLIKALTESSYPLHMQIAFIVMFLACFIGLLSLASSLSYYFKSDKLFVKKSRSYTYGCTIFALIYFILGYCLTFYCNLKNGASTSSYSATTISYVPFIITLISLTVASFFQGKSGVEFAEGKSAKAKKLKIEPLLYVVIITAVTFTALIFNVVEIKITAGSYLNEVKLNGYKLLTTYPKLEAGFQALAFILTAFFMTSGTMFVLTLISFFAKSKDYYKLVKTSAFANFLFVMVIALFGIYFQIAQKINVENITAILDQYGITLPADNAYEVTSQMIYAFAGSMVMMIIMLARGVFNLSYENSANDNDVVPEEKPAPPVMSAKDEVEKHDEAPQEKEPPKKEDFDACPAFTELDSKSEEFANALAEKRLNLFANLTLPNLVRFVVDYARECRLHLSYSLEDMATFVAGLGASRLTILQGMSGTGKTSLPKIFTEAVMGNCEIVEVESSWRDKNELLGYYNEFSKCFTPKKFTQCLYKARLNSEVLTLIVLDEMNLSRIEYYFSDFLSLMENEEDKREIKLLNVKLRRFENGEVYGYNGLTDGHTIKIPANVWFIGTANRDESTFEISDKVYDRAQTMNFNKRAPKIHSFSEPLSQKFVSYEMIAKLFEEAKNSFKFEAEANVAVQKTEKLLMPYNISFGNRILKQMEDFVKIYCTCFGDKDAVIKDAVEKILLSKVVSKLENKIVENKEALAVEFDKLGLNACSAFVRRLNED